MISINVDYPDLLAQFPEHLAPKRSESASFLIWYLEKYYRLDTLEAIDAVCDQSGDKGVDAIFINDSDQTITIFQSKISQKPNTTVGDAPLRAFLGTLAQFKSIDSVTHLVSTAGNAQVASLIKRSGLLQKLATYELRGEFLINIDLDGNGRAFLGHHAKDITFVGKDSLVSSYLSDERDLPIRNPTAFDILGVNVAEHVVDAGRKAVIAPVKARELVAMEGIADQSLFAYNVRGPLGRTKVNKDLVRSIQNNKTHQGCSTLIRFSCMPGCDRG
jgi:hypothetical protein